VNHGVSFSLLEKLKHEIEEFFKLPSEEKMKYKVRPGEFEGYGTVVRSENQKLDWVDRFYTIINPIHRRKPYLLPELPSSLRFFLSHSLSLSLRNGLFHIFFFISCRNTLETYFSALQKLAMTLVMFMAKALKMDTIREMKELFEDGFQSMRMSYYPPCPQPELVVGLSPHSDATLITILHQLNGVGGLQIKKDGVWMPMDFLPDAFVVNVGDVMEVCHASSFPMY
jgi:isopenicillin N synthase-like dioxygenase